MQIFFAKEIENLCKSWNLIFKQILNQDRPHQNLQCQHKATCDRLMNQQNEAESFALTIGIKNGSLKPRLEATVSTGSRQENIAPNRIILPTFGLTGNVARW